VNYENEHKLLEAGWQALTVWECELKKGCIDETIESLQQKIKKKKISSAK
jgi:G:T-mismatch repair DNA endonuclease (very short patch repair protein)